MVPNWAFPLGTWLAAYIYDHINLKMGLIVGGLLTLTGTWIRIFSSISFWFVVAGQIVGGIGLPFYYSSPHKVSAEWFALSERNSSTMAMWLIPMTLSSGYYLVPKLFVRSD